MIDDWKLRHRMFVEPQKSNLRRIGAPPVRAKVAAAIKLLLINPIQASVQNLLTAVPGQCAFAALHAQILDVEIIATNEADHPAVRTERFANLLVGITGQANSAIAAKLVIKEIVCKVDQRGCFTWIQVI